MDIIGFENYTISVDGSVFSKKSGIYLKHRLNNRGYYLVILYKDNEGTSKSIHQLIAEHYIPNPNNYKFVDHINRTKTDNSINNLRWVTSRQNTQNIKTQSIFGHNIYKIKSGNFQVMFCNNNSKSIYCQTFKTLSEAIIARNAFNETL